MLDLTRVADVGYIYLYLKEKGCFLRKKLGQNFLICKDTVNYILEQLDLGESDAVIEIGPGLGVITAGIVKRVKKLVCLEIDNKLAELIAENFKEYSNLELLKADALKIDFVQLVNRIKQDPAVGKVKIFSNLPYNIATPLIVELLQLDLPVEDMIFCVQSELKDRFQASPSHKNYSATSVIVQSAAIVKKLKKISKENFFPKPKIESTLIALKKNDLLALHGIDDRKAFFRFVKNCFAHRRKKMYNSLMLSGLFEKEQLSAIYRELNLDERIRAESLDIELFMQFFLKINNFTLS